MISQVIGIDCATNPRNVGLACARLEGGRYRLHTATGCSLREPPHALENLEGRVGAIEVCVVAGLDFSRGGCQPPDDRVLAEREGWIWALSRNVAAGASQ